MLASAATGPPLTGNWRSPRVPCHQLITAWIKEFIDATFFRPCIYSCGSYRCAYVRARVPGLASVRASMLREKNGARRARKGETTADPCTHTVCAPCRPACYLHASRLTTPGHFYLCVIQIYSKTNIPNYTLRNRNKFGNRTNQILHASQITSYPVESPVTKKCIVYIL